MKKQKLILLGGGGHCKSVINSIQLSKYEILGILDNEKPLGEKILDYHIIGNDEDITKYINDAKFVITVGQIRNAKIRIKLYEKVMLLGGLFETIIANTAIVSQYAIVGEGSVILHQAVVNADARIGKQCIINTFANIEHDVQIDDFCHVSTGAMINGGVKIGRETFVGSNAMIKQGICISSNSIIQGGSVVLKDVYGANKEENISK